MLRQLHHGRQGAHGQIRHGKNVVLPQNVPGIGIDISGATIADIDDRAYTGSAVEPDVTVTLGGATLVKGSDYTVAYSDNTDAGTATVTVTGKGNYAGTKHATFAIVRSVSVVPTRLADNTALDTMSKIVDTGFTKTGGTVVLATGSGYWDALTASGIAGLADAPVLLASMEDGGASSRLSPQTAAELARLKPSTIIVCGGTAVVPESVVSAAVEATGVSAEAVRCAGGTAAVSDDVKAQITKAGFTFEGRLADDTAVDTSEQIAEFEMDNGMSADNMAVATNNGFYDALTGAALCGKNYSVLVLVDGYSTFAKSNKATIDGFVKTNKASIGTAYIFGGTAAVSADTATYLANTLKLQSKRSSCKARAAPSL